MSASTSTDRVREDVERFLDQADLTAQVDSDGDLMLRADGALTWIRFQSVEDDKTAVVVYSPAVVGVTVDGELTRFLATGDRDLDFAHFELHDRNRPMVVVSHTLLGEHLSRDELITAVEAVTTTAARHGPDLAVRFGGWSPGGGNAAGQGLAELLAADSSRSPPGRRTSGASGLSTRQQAGVSLLVLLGAFAAGLIAHRLTGSWWPTGFVLALVGLVLGPAIVDVATRPDKGRQALLLLSVFVLTPMAVLALTHALFGAWWLAVLVSVVLGLPLGLFLASVLGPHLTGGPSERDKQGGRRAFLADGPS